MTDKIKGRVHSIQSLGTVDGPGVRFVLFMQGCNLRCGCCHNPDTHSMQGGVEYAPDEIFKRVLRCRDYFGEEGGVTVSGGEPILQPDFCYELFTLCQSAGINTCLDTSGSILTESVKRLLSVSDRVLLDIKYTENELYIKHAGCEMAPVLNFLDYLDEKSIKTTLRQVIIPTLNDTEENVLKLKEIGRTHSCVDKVELLPFKKICQVKYDNMNIPFPHGNLPTPTAEKMKKLNELLNS